MTRSSGQGTSAGTPARSLPIRDIRAAVGPAVQRGADRTWSLGDLDWPAIRPDALTEDDRSVVRFITFIEDHIPGYLTWLLDAFPIVGEDIGIDDFCANREYFRFFVTWAADEERHAAALTRYQVEAGMAETDDLLRELAAEGRKRFELPYEHPLQAFTYTMIQEKATQLFYQRFKAAAAEPVLRDLLRRLARDEARHFALYGQLVETYLRRGQVHAVPHVKDVLSTFRMPLSETLTGYRRWSLQVADSVGYDHTEAYEALERLVRDVVNAPGALDDDGLMSMVAAIRRLP
ncbi:acyl-ACP desaturase [Actinomadura rubrisoli]|uniref:Acyl-ACP desaturase n=1 Tax=Actinomadura rubrisoli TaxID=2530368 RepID=A0A4R5BAN4_9ACTN|nr:acyl-ACP desaturase [Actinomadura rubrisoli]TDD81750.1 acyl-ACP desaturase [Actinomadura rubrisoli]